VTEADEELHTETHDPGVTDAYAAFMRTGWGDRDLDLPPHPITPWATARRERLGEQFRGERLVVRIEGGPFLGLRPAVQAQRRRSRPLRAGAPVQPAGQRQAVGTGEHLESRGDEEPLG